MVYLLFLSILHLFCYNVSPLSDEEALKFKAELLESGISPGNYTRPCDDFPQYAAGSLYLQTLKGRKARVADEIMASTKTTFPPCKAVRDLYNLCKNQSKPLFGRKFIPGINEADAAENRARLRDFIGNNEFGNTDMFANEYKFTLQILFKFGADFFGENTMGKKIRIGRPDKKVFDNKDECSQVLGQDKCKDIANTVFDVQFKNEVPVIIYFPRTPEDRKQLFQDFWSIYNSPELGWYSRCDEFVADVFPMFFKKLYFDHLEDNGQPINGTERAFRRIWNETLEQIDDTIAFLNIIDKRRDLLHKQYHSDTVFLPLKNKIFDDKNFQEYYNFLEFSPLNELYQDRHLWSIRPLIRYNIDKGTDDFYTASWTRHTTVMHDNEKTFFGYGFEAFTYPFYHRSFPPSITFSNLIFALGDEKLSAILYNAYAKRNELHRQKNVLQLPGNAQINKFSEDQLYFVNLAQTIVLEQAQYNIDPFARPDAKIWKLFKCLRGFSNSFQCRDGDNYFMRHGCNLISPDLSANYSLSYYDSQDAVKLFLER